MTPYRTFEHDVANEASTTALRTVAVVVTLGAIVALAFTLPNWVGLFFAVLGVAAAAGWTAMIARARRRVAGAVTLRLTPDGLHYLDGVSTLDLPWSEIDAVDVDEDRLDVRIARRGAAPLRIEPMFRGASVYQLADAIRDAWRASLPAPDRSGR